ncbi:MAG TPA: hypothetical protein VH331_18715 [Allosphingosinicella sp.]|jgi:hypothetical protein|nr:hypothetical protein [Allosphingosinicella sp.]
MNGTDRNGNAHLKDLSGGAEGGMESGSAGGPREADVQRSNANQSDSGGDGNAAPGTASKVDLGKGSHEETQGGAEAGDRP